MLQKSVQASFGALAWEAELERQNFNENEKVHESRWYGCSAWGYWDHFWRISFVCSGERFLGSLLVHIAPMHDQYYDMGPSINDVTLFWAKIYPLPPCHISSQVFNPPSNRTSQFANLPPPYICNRKFASILFLPGQNFHLFYIFHLWQDQHSIRKTSKILYTRPAISLGHQEWRSVFWEGPKFFKLCLIVFSYAQHIFQG